MKLPLSEAEYFTELYSRFLIFANKKLKVIDNLEKPKDLIKTNPNRQMELRELIYKDMFYHINSFLDQGSLSEEEKMDVESWRQFIRSKFIVYRHLKNHTVFIDIENNAKIYGVLGLIDDMEKVLPPRALPLVCETNLLPFRDKIIYDGMIGAADLYEPEMERLTRAFIKDAKETGKIITSLPEENSVSKEDDWDGDDDIMAVYDTESGIFVRKTAKVGRNDPCPCGSGKKYKKCCGK